MLDPVLALIGAISVGVAFWLIYVVASWLLLYVLNIISTMNDNSDK
jgi:hypothetical protein